jgi:hypothetical protein
MDPVLMQKLASYMEASGECLAEVRDVLARYDASLERRDYQKTASLSALQPRVKEVVDKLATTPLLSGDVFVSGLEQIKQAEAMANDHEQTLELLGMVLDEVKRDRRKAAAAEPGYSVPRTSGMEKLSASDQFVLSQGIHPFT